VQLIQSSSPEEIFLAAKKKDVKETQLLPSDKPWLMVVRPGNRFVLCFKRQDKVKGEERKGRKEAPGWKKMFKRSWLEEDV